MRLKKLITIIYFMKKLNSFLLLICVVFLLTGCAMRYHSIDPVRQKYKSNGLENGIELSYKYDILRESGNSKYAKKEYKNGIKLIAVKLTNNTDSTLTIGKDILFFSGNKEVLSLSPVLIKNTIHQNEPAYLFYLLFTFTTFTVSNGYSAQTYPIGYALGPILTLTNLITASSANKNLLLELNRYDIMNKDLHRGETIYGIIGIREYSYDPISIRIIKR